MSPLYPNPGRRTPASGAHIFLGQRNIFFATVTAKNRLSWMSHKSVQSSLVNIWRELATAWLVGYYLLMPDHMHFFCAPRDLRFGIDQWITYWKSEFSRGHLDEPWEFQRRAFHHRMRDMREYEEQLAYVRENPVRKNLVRRSEEWPYQGTVHLLRW